MSSRVLALFVLGACSYSPPGEIPTCRLCPEDCACTPRCGDFLCDPDETDCPGDCS